MLGSTRTGARTPRNRSLQLALHGGARHTRTKGALVSDFEQNLEKVKGMEIAGFGMGTIVTGFGLLLWSPIVDGWNWIGFIITIIGLTTFGGFAKGKWY